MKLKTSRLNDIGITLTEEEINCFKKVFQEFDLLKQLKKIERTIFDDKASNQVKKLIYQLETKHKWLSSYSRRRKFNTLLVDFISEIIDFIVYYAFDFDKQCIEVLIDLRLRIKPHLNKTHNP